MGSGEDGVYVDPYPYLCGVERLFSIDPRLKKNHVCKKDARVKIYNEILKKENY